MRAQYLRNWLLSCTLSLVNNVQF